VIDPLDPGTFDLVLPAQPMSSAERQRRHRQKLKELRETEGLRAVSLTQTERMVLSLGLLAHEDLFHRGPNWAAEQKPGFDSLLVKLWPEGDNGRYLAEPERTTRRPAGFLRDEVERLTSMIKRMEESRQAERDELQALRQENQELKAAIREVAEDLGVSVRAPAQPAAAVNDAELARLRHECEILEGERNNAFAAVKVFQSRLQLNKLSTDYRPQPGE